MDAPLLRRLLDGDSLGDALGDTDDPRSDAGDDAPVENDGEGWACSNDAWPFPRTGDVDVDDDDSGEPITSSGEVVLSREYSCTSGDGRRMLLGTTGTRTINGPSSSLADTSGTT